MNALIKNNVEAMLKYRGAGDVKVIDRVQHTIMTATVKRHNELLNALAIVVDQELTTNNAGYNSMCTRELANNKNIDELILIVHTDKPVKVELNSKTPIYVRVCNAKHFVFNVPNHITNPYAKLADPKEVEEFTNANVIAKDSFARILVTDPYAEWLGLRVGDHMKIRRRSETAMIEEFYRYCV